MRPAFSSSRLVAGVVGFQALFELFHLFDEHLGLDIADDDEEPEAG